MKPWIIVVGALWLAGCAATPSLSAEANPVNPNPAAAALYPDLGAAPELVGEVWLNTDGPLKLADVRGKVVLVDMWTFGCINCKNVIPSLRGWHEAYADQGLVVIGNHYPEFSFEADLDNLKQAVIDLDVPYPVVQDNHGLNWGAYRSRAWPSLYVIDKQGHIRYTHVGEGRYRETEAAIVALLNE